PGPDDDSNSTVVIRGTASFQNVTALPVELRASRDANGNVQIVLRYTLRGATPTATDWRFSTSFPNLPRRLNGAAVTDAASPAPLDTLDLFDTAFVVSNHVCADP